MSRSNCGRHELQAHLLSPFGQDWYGRYAEGFTRLVGRPAFLIIQTAVVVAWIAVNLVAVGLRWDPYPFILLNLVFSLEAAYAAPLILLAQTREADREKAAALIDAHHRDAVAEESLKRQELAADRAEQLRALLESNRPQTEQLRTLLESNTALTEETRRLAEQLGWLAREIFVQVRASADLATEAEDGRASC